MATNKDKALQIVNKLFEICEKDYEVKFSGHCGEMVVSCGKGDNYFHSHIFSHNSNFSDELQQVLQALHKVESLQEVNNEKSTTNLLKNN